MKRRRRLRYEEPDTTARDAIRATRDAFYAQRRGDPVEAAQPEQAKVELVGTKPESVTVPADWQDLHWKKRVQLARGIWPGFQFVNGADADKAIRRYLGDE